MKTLLLETATEKSYLCLMDGETLLSIPLPNGPELSKNLALEIHNLLKINNFQPEQIAVGQGPGSFTGVRVGTAMAKALSFGWGIPLVQFCSLKTFIPKEDGAFAILIDVRMGGVYALCGNIKGGKLIQCLPAVLLSSLELEEKVKDIPLLISPHPQLIEKRIKRVCIEGEPHFFNIRLDLKPAGALR